MSKDSKIISKIIVYTVHIDLLIIKENGRTYRQRWYQLDRLGFSHNLKK